MGHVLPGQFDHAEAERVLFAEAAFVSAVEEFRAAAEVKRRDKPFDLGFPFGLAFLDRDELGNLVVAAASADVRFVPGKFGRYRIG